MYSRSYILTISQEICTLKFKFTTSARKELVNSFTLSDESLKGQRIKIRGQDPHHSRCPLGHIWTYEINARV